MKNKLSIIFIALVIFFTVVFGIRFLSGEDNWICQDGQWVKHGNPSSPMPITICGYKIADSKELPQGYTLDSYKIEEISNDSCQKDSECITPGKYLMQSNCPYTSLCLKNKCAVVCPSH